MKKAVSVFMVRTGDVESGKWMVDGRWPTVLASVVIASAQEKLPSQVGDATSSCSTTISTVN